MDSSFAGLFNGSVLSAIPGGVTRGAPLLGEHTREVLEEYGYGDGEIDALICDGAVIAM